MAAVARRWVGRGGDLLEVVMGRVRRSGSAGSGVTVVARLRGPTIRGRRRVIAEGGVFSKIGGIHRAAPSGRDSTRSLRLTAQRKPKL